jgi:hypothetical protein
MKKVNLTVHLWLDLKSDNDLACQLEIVTHPVVCKYKSIVYNNQFSNPLISSKRLFLSFDKDDQKAGASACLTNVKIASSHSYQARNGMYDALRYL